jgi:hypothetical protein
MHTVESIMHTVANVVHTVANMVMHCSWVRIGSFGVPKLVALELAMNCTQGHMVLVVLTLDSKIIAPGLP